jgi:3-hydroxypropanoate dehydrogenase
MSSIHHTALEVLFKNARSQNGWGPDPVGEHELRAAYEIAKWGPTSMNTQPMRILFLRTAEGKERLKPALAPTNVSKVAMAPVVALIAYDAKFHQHLPKIFPHNPNAQSLFASNESLSESTAFRNGTLQAAYFMIALRAVGLDVGPMSGFDPVKVNAEFFADTSLHINFICAIGHGDGSKIFPRSPRFEFDEVAHFS